MREQRSARSSGRQVWLCRARQPGSAFPTFADAEHGIELLNWQRGGTILLRGRAKLVSAWAVNQQYTTPQPPVAGLYLVDETTVFYIDAHGELAGSVDAVRASLFGPSSGQPLSEAQACEVLVKANRVFSLSDLSSFQVQRLLLEWFGVRSRPPESRRGW
ncbi:hypothetical protein GCM10022631_17350 [Deinococcus rubellus]|uniref:hypothetical protein n=1 Tax=Deinococcus rubellus TaxID=1889240 RepID=UPI0031F00D20